MKPYARVRGLLVLLAIMACDAVADGQNGLVLDYRLYTSEILERCPLVVRLSVRNTGMISVKTIFRSRNPDAINKRSRLILRSEDGNSYSIDYLDSVLDNVDAPIAEHSLEGGGELSTDSLFPLIKRRPRNTGVYDYLPPGTYTGQFEVRMLGGDKLTSKSFDIVIKEAQGDEAVVRELIHIRHAGFMQGKQFPYNTNEYDGRKFRGKVNVSRYGELQRILENHPDSTYAQWIRFWKVYHHGSEDEALAYARAHRDFPLSDNLMFRVVKRIAHDDARYDEATALIAELERLFPGGDAAGRANALRQALPRKRKR